MSNTYESGQICSDSYIDWKGEILNNRYICLKKLGYGSSASVWVAFDNQMDICVAIKIFNLDDYENGEYEITLLKRINTIKNDYGIKFIDSFDHDTNDGTHICAVLELLKNSLYNYIKKNDLSLLDIKIITKQILLFLVDLNKNGLVHTDIKPENILICEENDISNIVLKLVKSKDFQNKIINKKKELLKNNKINIKKVNITMLAKKHLLIAELDNMDICSYDSSNSSNSSNNSNSSDSSDSSDCSDSSCDSNNNYFMNKNMLEKSNNTEEIEQSSNDQKENILTGKNSDKLIDIKNKFDIYSNQQKIKKIKVADFNTCQDITNIEYEIQTRYYRAPEIILENHFSEKMDVWSLGCTMYELLTKTILINSDDYEGACKDRYHMYLIQSKIKLLDIDFINTSKKKYIFIDSNNLLKGFRNFKSNLFWKELIDTYGENSDYGELTQLYNFIDFLLECLEPNPEIRKTPIKLLEHSFLQ